MAVHFTDAVVAQRYALFRPHYPESLLNGLLKYVRGHVATPVEQQLVVDVGCGSGQSTFILGKVGFKKIHGIDTSKAQITEAMQLLANQPRPVQEQVSFSVVNADEGLAAEDGTVDIVTVAQALHWLDLAQFYPHVDKALKPGGLFLALGYGNMQVMNDDVQRIVAHFYSKKMGTYWSQERRHINEMFANMPMPYSPVERLLDDPEHSTTVSHVIGYISSWSAYATYCDQHPDNTALDDLRQEIIQAAKSSDADTAQDIGLRIKFPFFAFMCQKPPAAGSAV